MNKRILHYVGVGSGRAQAVVLVGGGQRVILHEAHFAVGSGTASVFISAGSEAYTYFVMTTHLLTGHNRGGGDMHLLLEDGLHVFVTGGDGFSLTYSVPG